MLVIMRLNQPIAELKPINHHKFRPFGLWAGEFTVEASAERLEEENVKSVSDLLEPLKVVIS